MREPLDRDRLQRRSGPIDVFHYDPVSQALAKLARGYERDLSDVDAILARGLVTRAGVRDAFDAVSPLIDRYPRLDAKAFTERVNDFTEPR